MLASSWDDKRPSPSHSLPLLRIVSPGCHSAPLVPGPCRTPGFPSPRHPSRRHYPQVPSAICPPPSPVCIQKLGAGPLDGKTYAHPSSIP